MNTPQCAELASDEGMSNVVRLLLYEGYARTFFIYVLGQSGSCISTFYFCVSHLGANTPYNSVLHPFSNNSSSALIAP